MPYRDPEARREWNRAHMRDQHLRLTYGISAVEYDRLVMLQCGSCAICGDVPCEDPDGRNSAARLCVDHDHSTGEVRGLICHRCNRGLGYFRDSLISLANARTYLVEGAFL